MRFTEEQLKSWAAALSETEDERAQHSIKMIKDALLESDDLINLDYDIFLQGSYANNTNVRTDSDVDVCVMLKSTFYYRLPNGRKPEEYGIVPATMTFPQFRGYVKDALVSMFGKGNVSDGNKSLKIGKNTYHVQADVVPAFQYRYYSKINGDIFIEGIKFYSQDGREVINYPKLHKAHGISKNNNTQRKYKRLVRIMKHIKNNMAESGLTDGDKITSFLIECLVWNLPDELICRCDNWNETVYLAICYLYTEIQNQRHIDWKEVSRMLPLFMERKWTDRDVMQWLVAAWNYMDFVC